MATKKTKRDSPRRLETKSRTRIEAREQARLRKAALSDAEKQRLVDKCVDRIGTPKDREAFREILGGLVKNNAIPASLLSKIPQRATEAGKTRIEQIYDACMFLAFPDYRDITKDRAFGPLVPSDMKLWRALFPKELGLSHVIIRARSFQEAFGLACDYACRLSLMEHKRIPADMTIRVQFLADSPVSRMLAIRRAVRDYTRLASNLKGRTYSSQCILGARLVALSREGGGKHSIFKYAERKDLDRILAKTDELRVSSVDIETFRPKDPPP